ncbi:hypothetical protein PHYPSEUDO_003901 [Phytophthora pseudosyringae]|uniref:Protein kinase domain-containing protein n=1 Tax=Phytophthora pseudosyringae TaxID=221518 RepID=A0A8T1VQ30_9STRA|nr:hypothetical protein PHYPSEUDO_003901 [Phytophthora pseudosyringae]
MRPLSCPTTRLLAFGRAPERATTPRVSLLALIRAFATPDLELAMAAAPTLSFPVDRLRDKSSLRVLVDLRRRCSHNVECAQLFTHAFDRIAALNDSVAPLDATSPTKRKYIAVLVRLVKLTHREPLLKRLATSHSTQYRTRELHVDLDTVATEVGFIDTAGVMQWQEAWVRSCDALRARLTEMVANASERMLVNELTGETQLEEVLMMLFASLTTNEPQEFLQFKLETHHRVRKFFNLIGATIFNWFIPRDSVAIDTEACLGSGTFGDVWRGSLLLQNGENQSVVIKKLNKAVSGDSNAPELFLSQLQFWNRLMENDAIPKTNILKLYGGTHIGKPQLYVCEDAANGNLLDFLGRAENKPRFWEMFLQVAKGLQVLHAQKIVHGGLKCSNILVTADNTAKLSDFGFSFIRSLSIELSTHRNRAMAHSVRWKAREMLEESADANVRYASDVYSMGMCMIEAITEEIPFGMEDDEAVMIKIMTGDGHPRPHCGESDETWTLITQLCNTDVTKRLTLDQAVERIAVLATNAPGA